MVHTRLVAVGVSLVAFFPSQVSAVPSPEALTAWDRHVATTEARRGEPAQSPRGERVEPPVGIAADGSTIDVGSGTISDWSGSVFVVGATVDQVLHRLQYPGTPPPQQDVVSSRVLARGDDSLRVYIRLVRKSIVTVAYDTEHEMTFRRWSPVLATARSVATRIEEVGGGDHGFLWRLHSYWRYDQAKGGVVVSLESLTLSRHLPMLVKHFAGAIISGIARESMVRTLEALKQYVESSVARG
jgi:hypothetical protein